MVQESGARFLAVYLCLISLCFCVYTYFVESLLRTRIHRTPDQSKQISKTRASRCLHPYYATITVSFGFVSVGAAQPIVKFAGGRGEKASGRSESRSTHC